MRQPTKLALLAAGLLLATLPHAAHGQVAGRTLGVGAHIGEPVGLSVKYYDRPGAAYDLLAAFDFDDDVVFANAHRVWERPLPPAAPMRFFHGPGLFVGTGPGDGAAFGLSYTAGLSLPFDRLEASLQLTPRLRVLPDTEFDLGGGLGLRYYFSI